jgi:hypothetical protein
MKTILLIAGAASITFAAGPVLAQPAPASPKAPIPYSQLNAYLKATPKQRATKDWWSSAQTGTSTDTSVRASVSPNLPGDTNVTPPAATSGDKGSTAVNPLPGDEAPTPPTTAAPGSPPATAPPK